MIRFLGSIAAALLLLGTAQAAPPSNADPALAPWFQSLHTAAGMSCCGDADGHILGDADWRVAGNGYQVRIDGEWTNVEPDAVLNGVPNPVGSPVAFWSPGASPHRIFCFVRATET